MPDSKTINAQSGQQARPAHVFRGVHSEHPQLGAARLGQVIPGNVAGNVTPEEHNAGGRSADSQYTSWTHSRAYAEKRALDRGPGGVVLRLPMSPPNPSEGWSWQDSPDLFDEEEVLLLGIRMDAEVLK